MWTGYRRTREYNFIVIEEVMQQKVPKVPSNVKVQQPQSSSFIRKGVAANFFKATFSSRSKAVPTAAVSNPIQETNKIGSAETKPVTRNRPRSVLPTEAKLKRRSSERTLSLRIDKPVEPSKPLRTKTITPDPGGPKTPDKLKNDLGSNVLKIIKKSPAPPKTSKTPDSLLPPSLKPKLPEKVKLKREKYVNNNTVWTNANVIKSEKKLPFIG
ncbi:unnamed protein product [Euphydryas editha]|uniref:Uncharacterized protein n=1 Tax=Euphydryas editha TaxID=104508 RepID=A0AAU9U3P7_EUPED|nr:unnamed protein product [Euphydryas editha]